MPDPTALAAPDLSTKRILVTGGTTGIGRATVQRLAELGAKPLLFGRHRPELDETLQQAGLDPQYGLTADAARLEDLDRVFEAVDRTLGGLDVLIACAALGAQPINEMAEQEWRYVVETNLLGYMSCTRRAIERMEGRGGQIVLISSISPEILAPGESVYAATKAGVNAFALTLRKELGDKDIRVSVIEPGSVGTPMQECSPEEQRQAIARGEMLVADEIAEAVLFVLSRGPTCDVAMLRIEPVRQKTS